VLLSALPVLVVLGLTVYAGIDCLQAPPEELHRMSRGRWLAMIVLLPVIGALTWLVANRPVRGRHGRAANRSDRRFADPGRWVDETARAPLGPDDDPEFLAGLGRAQRERQRLLTRQEEERRRRERRGDEEQNPPEQP
jgi:Phospholipase_D-nuclease N-terminal